MNSRKDKEFARQFRSVVRRALLLENHRDRPRTGCPDALTLKVLALAPTTLTSRGELTEHIVQCSRCYRDVEYWRRRQRLKRLTAAFTCVGAVMLATFVGSHGVGRRQTEQTPKTAARDSMRSVGATETGTLTPLSPDRTKTKRSNPVASFVLLEPNTTRSGQNDGPANTLTIESGMFQVRILLDIAQDNRSQYSVLLQTADGADIQRFDRLRSERIPHGGRAVSVTIPAEILRDGTYIVRLFGQPTDELGAYPMRVLR